MKQEVALTLPFLTFNCLQAYTLKAQVDITAVSQGKTSSSGDSCSSDECY